MEDADAVPGPLLGDGVEPPAKETTVLGGLDVWVVPPLVPLPDTGHGSVKVEGPGTVRSKESWVRGYRPGVVTRNQDRDTRIL